ncbi:hypothetical protein MTO96_051323 [Rhipicephalus appendiculatus]
MSNLEKHDFNERLIDEVKKENAIWDMSGQHYKSQLLKEVAWRRIATAMGCNGDGRSEGRWKNLRDSFRRVYKARLPALKSGAGAEDSEDEDAAKAWVFYDRLLFLKDSIVGRPTSRNLELLCEEESEITERPRTDKTAESIFEDIISESSTSPEPDTYQATRREVSLGTAVQASTASSQSSRKRKKPYDDEISSLATIVSRVPDEAEHFGQLIAANFSDSGVCSYWSLPVSVSPSQHLLSGHGRTRRICYPSMRWNYPGRQINLSSEHPGLRTSCPSGDRINQHRGFQSAI